MNKFQSVKGSKSRVSSKKNWDNRFKDINWSKNNIRGKSADIVILDDFNLFEKDKCEHEFLSDGSSCIKCGKASHELIKHEK